VLQGKTGLESFDTPTYLKDGLPYVGTNVDNETFDPSGAPTNNPDYN
jgi:hypothetical protein